ncbi:MAG: hypothetical protein WBD40_08495 [Tepidisphaeraceae bacterium]
MPSLLIHPADLLRSGPIALRSRSPVRTLVELALLVVVFGFAYGAVMGTYAGPGGGPRVAQMVFSATKVPLLLLVTFVISLPSFFVLNTLLGVRDDFAEAVRALVATQAALTIILASLAPITAFWYASVDGYRHAILFNAAMFGVASFAAQFLLRRLYRPLIERNLKHRLLLRAWLVVFAFVGIQMGWVLRPFIGNPAMPTRFFREGAWGNAYVEVAIMIREVFGG